MCSLYGTVAAAWAQSDSLADPVTAHITGVRRCQFAVARCAASRPKPGTRYDGRGLWGDGPAPSPGQAVAVCESGSGPYTIRRRFALSRT